MTMLRCESPLQPKRDPVDADLLGEPGSDQKGGAPMMALPTILARTTREITAVLNSLHRSRSFLEQAAVPRLRRTHRSLRQASQASEDATHVLLDGLSHALLLLDQLDDVDDIRNPNPNPPAHAIRFDLREEVYRLICSLQFQDIVAQQIAYATHALEDTARRLAIVTAQFDVAVLGRSAPEAEESERAVERGATALANAAIERQALADSVFGSSRTNQNVEA